MGTLGILLLLMGLLLSPAEAQKGKALTSGLGGGRGGWGMGSDMGSPPPQLPHSLRASHPISEHRHLCGISLRSHVEDSALSLPKAWVQPLVGGLRAHKLRCHKNKQTN